MLPCCSAPGRFVEREGNQPDYNIAGKKKMSSIMRLLRSIALFASFVTTSTAAALRADDALEIARDTVLDPQRTYSAIVIKASNVTIDGQGAWLLGPASQKTGPSSSDFRGAAISAKGVSNVRLRNVNARGWETGLKVVDGTGWLVEQCNFSDNFHDPSFGWGENGRRGGILFNRVRLSTNTHCRANRVWDACVLFNSLENTIEDNDFSHTSNTALKLWASGRNRVRRNDFSYGLRKNPGEVHARDSTCVLIESGSNENHLEDNNCTHGGDGIFIRVLNGWVSTGNVLERNDCSYANNNGFEA
jgi:parallel beta-helix repeat protein